MQQGGNGGCWIHWLPSADQLLHTTLQAAETRTTRNLLSAAKKSARPPQHRRPQSAIVQRSDVGASPKLGEPLSCVVKVPDQLPAGVNYDGRGGSGRGRIHLGGDRGIFSAGVSLKNGSLGGHAYGNTAHNAPSPIKFGTISSVSTLGRGLKARAAGVGGEHEGKQASSGSRDGPARARGVTRGRGISAGFVPAKGWPGGAAVSQLAADLIRPASADRAGVSKYKVFS